MRILLVEDDECIGQVLKNALNESASAVDWVQDGELEAVLTLVNRDDVAELAKEVKGRLERVKQQLEKANI